MVARHEVPGKPTSDARPVGNGAVGLVSANRTRRGFSKKREFSPHEKDIAEDKRTRSYRPLWDGSLGPFPGTSCQATIIQSLRDGARPCRGLRGFFKKLPADQHSADLRRTAPDFISLGIA
jgi:hypothetical protein